MAYNTECIITTNELDFGFHRKEQILKKLTLQVEKGSIYGFLGPNGAGKTTTIRLLLGLLPSPAQSIRLFGRELDGYRLEVFSRIGALIEQPSLYEQLSGTENLEITRRLRNLKKQRIEAVLELVRLQDAADKEVKAYSLGMKQRLGLAIALLGEPELLILDEPVNGLDPQGIVEIRELLKTINKECGTTIFLSSHLLSEIERIVTHIGIINNGELMFQGTLPELAALTAETPELRLETNDNARVMLLCRGRRDARIDGDEVAIACRSKEQAAEIIRSVAGNTIAIYKAAYGNGDLERLFLEMTRSVRVR